MAPISIIETAGGTLLANNNQGGSSSGKIKHFLLTINYIFPDILFFPTFYFFRTFYLTFYFFRTFLFYPGAVTPSAEMIRIILSQYQRITQPEQFTLIAFEVLQLLIRSPWVLREGRSLTSLTSLTSLPPPNEENEETPSVAYVVRVFFLFFLFFSPLLFPSFFFILFFTIL
jgi:hypothetical protein